MLVQTYECVRPTVYYWVYSYSSVMKSHRVSQVDHAQEYTHTIRYLVLFLHTWCTSCFLGPYIYRAPTKNVYGYRTRLSLAKVTQTRPPCLTSPWPYPKHGMIPPIDTAQGRRSGRVRYRDFVKAMGNPLSPRGPASGYGGSRAGGGKKKGRRHRSSPDDIERLVDRLKEVGGTLQVFPIH